MSKKKKSRQYSSITFFRFVSGCATYISVSITIGLILTHFFQYKFSKIDHCQKEFCYLVPPHHTCAENDNLLTEQ